MKAKAQMAVSTNGQVTAYELEDGRVALVYDPKGSHGLSNSGKTWQIAGVGGQLRLPNGNVVSLSVYRKPTPAELAAAPQQG